MAYQVDRFNGTFLVAVSDGSIDTTTDLRLVGKNYAGYGELQNENFVHLLENFSNTTPPPRAISGQIWYDSGKKKLRFFDGVKFKVANGAEVSPTAPSGLSEGEFWWDTEAKQLYAWSGTQFELIGPEISAEAGQTSVVAAAVKDQQGNTNNILKLIADDETIAVVSRTAFVLSEETPILNFTNISKGITLTRSTTGISSNDFFFWGTASNSDRLGSVPASEYLRKGNIIFNDTVAFTDIGYTVGDENDYRVSIVQKDLVIDSQLGSNVKILIADGSVKRNIATFSKTSITPGSNNLFDIGTTALKWRNVYATKFFGDVEGNLLGNTQGTHKGNVIANDNTVLVNATTKEIGGTGITVRGNFIGDFNGTVTGTSDNALTLTGLSPSVTSAGLTIVQRDSAGSIEVNVVNGTATRSERLRINNSAVDAVWSNSNVATQYRSAKTNKDPWSIAARDSGGNLNAEVFNGTATSARYADLAEKYLADADYEVGTVIAVGGDKEVTASSENDLAIGVISQNPAYMMNCELEGGVYVALKGRVPVKVIGQVKKGQRLVPTDNGCARATSNLQDSNVFGVALENSDNLEIKFIEAVIL